MSYSLGFLKPDCLKRHLEQNVYDIIESHGLKVVFKKRLKLSFFSAQRLYADWHSMFFYQRLCEFVSSDQIEVFIVEGDDAVNGLEKVVGGHDTQWRSDSIRGIFASSILENIIHSTTSGSTFRREAEILLGKEAERWVFENVGI